MIYEPVRINNDSLRWLSGERWKRLHPVNDNRNACEPECGRAASARPSVIIFPEWSGRTELIPIGSNEAADRMLDVAALNESLSEYSGFAANLGFIRPIKGQRQRDIEHTSQLCGNAKAFRLLIKQGEPLSRAAGLIEDFVKRGD